MGGKRRREGKKNCRKIKIQKSYPENKDFFLSQTRKNALRGAGANLAEETWNKG